MVRSLLKLSLASVFALLVFAQSDEPTHIVKFKPYVSRTSGKKKEKQRDYLLIIRIYVCVYTS